MAPERGHSPFHRWLIVPVMSPDHDATVVIVAVVIPSAMQAAVVLVESETRAIVTIAVVTAITAHIDAEPAGTCSRRHADGQGRQSSQRIRELLHGSSPLVATWKKTNA